MIFTLLLSIALMVLVAMTIVASALAAWFCRKKPWKRFFGVQLVMVTPLILFFLAMNWLLGPSEPKDSSSLNAAYKSQFGSPPSADVAALQYRYYVVEDSCAEWLRFKASTTTVETLVKRMVPCTQKIFEQSASSPNAPPWMAIGSSDKIRYYQAERWQPELNHSEAVLAHDTEDGVVYFSHSGF